MSITYPANGVSYFAGGTYGIYEHSTGIALDAPVQRRAVVWNDALAEVWAVQYDDTTTASTRSDALAVVDATPTIVQAGREYLLPLLIRHLVDVHNAEQRIVKYGDRVRVVYGREAGREGVVRFVNPGRLSKADHGPRTYTEVGVALEGNNELRFMPVDAVQRTEIIPPHMQTIARRAEQQLSTAQGIANTYRRLFFSNSRQEH